MISMEEKVLYQADSLEVLYNIYGKFIVICRVEKKVDGDVIFHDLDTGESMDLESYAIHGYKLLRDKYQFFNQFKDYSLEDIKLMEENFDVDVSGKRDRRRLEFDNSSLIDLNWLKDNIESNRYNYDLRYPVEQIEIRHSDILQDYLFLYVKFDPSIKEFVYMDITTGQMVSKEILDLYTYYSRDHVFEKSDYSPREIMELKEQLKKGVKKFTKRRNG